MLSSSRIILALCALSLFVSCWAYDPYVQVKSSPLLVVKQVFFNATCSVSTAGCWEVELLYKTESAHTALFVPGHPSWSAFASAQEYEDTFAGANFPCSVASYDPAAPSAKESACCIESFLSKYRTAASFRTWAAGKPSGAFSYPSGACNTGNGSSLVNDAALAVVGDFDSGMAEVLAVASQVGDPAGSSRAMVFIPDDKLQNITIQGSRGRKFFVGMVSFTPAGTRFLDSSVQQVSIEVEKTLYATVTTSATSDITFINWVNARVNRVSSKTSPDFAYYATISFAIDMSPNLIPNPISKLIPDSSVLLGQVDHACNASQLADLPSSFYQILSQDSCSPWADAATAASSMCAGDQQTSFNANDGVGLINIPLGTTVPSTELDIQFVVALQNGAGTPYYSTVSILLTTADNSFTTWCDSDSGSTNFAADYVTSSLIVGSALTAPELSSLQTISPLTATEIGTPPVNVEASQDAKSLQSGLLTFVLDGSALPDESMTVHIEDMFTLHINGDATEQAVNAELAATPFNITEDLQAKTASLQLSANLSKLCPSNPSSYLEACSSRREVDDKSTLATTYQLKSGDPAAFMQTLFGSESTFAAELGTNYETIINDEYSLDTRTKAWWITPGFNWTGPGTSGSGVFALSSKVLIVALYKIEDSATGSSRRHLLVNTRSTVGTGADSGSVSETTVQYDVDAVSLTAAVHAVDADLVTAWTFGLALAPAQACLPEEDLRAWARETLLSLFRAASSGIQNVQVAAVRVNAAGVRCDGSASLRSAPALQGSSQRRSAPSPSIDVDVLLVFKPSLDASSGPYMDANAIISSPAVISMQETRSSPVVRLSSGRVSSASRAPDAPDAPVDAEIVMEESRDSDGDSTLAGSVLIAAAVLFLGSLCCAAAALNFWWRSRHAASTMLDRKLSVQPSEFADPIQMWVEADLIQPSKPVFRCRSMSAPSIVSGVSTRVGSAVLSPVSEVEQPQSERCSQGLRSSSSFDSPV